MTSVKKEVKRNDFLCPKCKEQLRVGDHVIFKVKNEKKEKGLILLSPQTGNCSSIKHPSFEYAKSACATSVVTSKHILLIYKSTQIP